MLAVRFYNTKSKMNTLSRKSYSAIYVNNVEDIEKVKEIIKGMDEF